MSGQHEVSMDEAIVRVITTFDARPVLATLPPDSDQSPEAQRRREIHEAAAKAARQSLIDKPLSPEILRDVVAVIFKDDVKDIAS